MSLHVVLGKGPVGSTLADRLVDAGHEVRVLSRSGGSDPRPTVEHVALDAGDATALSAAAAGAVALYNCANPAYHRWPTDWPPIAAALLAAAESSGAVLVVMGNLYGYGPVSGPMTEQLLLASTGSKGRVRIEMYEQALRRHEAGALRMVEARGADFVGPGVTDGGLLGSRAVPRSPGCRTWPCAPSGCSTRRCASWRRPATSSSARSCWTAAPAPPPSASRPRCSSGLGPTPSPGGGPARRLRRTGRPARPAG